jgi:alpha-methylacyl-CoA racemase
MEHTDVCFAPVLTMSEAAVHPHNVQRNTFVDVAGVKQPAPAPRFSRTTVAIARPPSHPGQDTRDVLADYGMAAADIDKLIETGAVKQA